MSELNSLCQQCGETRDHHNTNHKFWNYETLCDELGPAKCDKCQKVEINHNKQWDGLSWLSKRFQKHDFTCSDVSKIWKDTVYIKQNILGNVPIVKNKFHVSIPNRQFHKTILDKKFHVPVVHRNQLNKSGRVGISLDIKLEPTKEPGKKTWFVLGTLPPGLVENSITDPFKLQVSGDPNYVGEWEVTVAELMLAPPRFMRLGKIATLTKIIFFIQQ